MKRCNFNSWKMKLEEVSTVWDLENEEKCVKRLVFIQQNIYVYSIIYYTIDIIYKDDCLFVSVFASVSVAVCGCLNILFINLLQFSRYTELYRAHGFVGKWCVVHIGTGCMHVTIISELYMLNSRANVCKWVECEIYNINTKRTVHKILCLDADLFDLLVGARYCKLVKSVHMANKPYWYNLKKFLNLQKLGVIFWVFKGWGPRSFVPPFSSRWACLLFTCAFVLELDNLINYSCEQRPPLRVDSGQMVTSGYGQFVSSTDALSSPMTTSSFCQITSNTRWVLYDTVFFSEYYFMPFTKQVN